MPAKTGASHGFAAFGTLVIGTVLSKYVWTLLPPVGESALVVIQSLKTVTGADIPVTEQFAGTVVLMIGLSFIWGVVYHVGRH